MRIGDLQVVNGEFAGFAFDIFDGNSGETIVLVMQRV